MIHQNRIVSNLTTPHEASSKNAIQRPANSPERLFVSVSCCVDLHAWRIDHDAGDGS